MPELDRELGFETDLDVGTQETEESVVVTPETRQFVDVFGFDPEQNIIHDSENESHEAPVGHEIDIETANGGDASKVVDFKHPELEIGEQSTPVVVVTPEKKVHANMPIVKDVEEIAKKSEQEATELTQEEKEWVSENSNKKLVSVYEVDDIKNIDGNILDKLECGDIVIKKTKSGNRTMHHCYQVSYYEHKHGCCLTYTAAGYIETQSYDYTDGHWVYNSQDLWQAE